MSKIKNLITLDNIYCVYCITLAWLGTYFVYPFIGLADGFKRWDMSMELIDNGVIKNNTVLSPTIPVLQAVTYKQLLIN